MTKSINFFLLFLLYSAVLGQYSNSLENDYTVCIENGKAVSDPESFISQIPKPVQLTGQINSLTITADFPIAYVWIYNDQGIDIFDFVNDELYVANIPAGMYHILMGYAPSEHTHSFFIRDSISISSDTTLAFLKKEVIHTTEFKFVRENSDALRINTISFSMFNNLLGTGFGIRCSNIDSTSFLFKYNKISSYLDCEWAVKGKQLANAGNLYLLNGQLIGLEKDTLITNAPINLVYADFIYHLPDSINKKYEIQLFTFNPSSHQDGPFDCYYSYPFVQRVFQDTSANISLRSSIFWQGIYVVNILYNYLCTPEIRIKEDYIQGYYYSERSALPFKLSETKTVQIGLTPTYWFGRFVNEADTIKIRSPYGRWNYLFLSQTNDILRHYPIDYSIFSEDSLYSNGQFHLWFEPQALRLGFDSTGLTIPVSQGKYEMTITDKQNEVALYPGISQVKAVFNLNSVDKNPPYLSLFQISSDGVLANVLGPSSENKILFRLEDDNEVFAVELFYTTLIDTSWVILPLEESAPYYFAYLPNLKDGYYCLKLKATDGCGNSIECLMEPAFHMGKVTSIEENNSDNHLENFNIFYNYPNPFNSSTHFIFNVNEKDIKNIEITIYDLLGRKLKQIDIGQINLGINNVSWNGLDKNGKQVSSGLYIAKLKGGNKVKMKKLLLIR